MKFLPRWRPMYVSPVQYGTKTCVQLANRFDVGGEHVVRSSFVVGQWVDDPRFSLVRCLGRSARRRADHGVIALALAEVVARRRRGSARPAAACSAEKTHGIGVSVKAGAAGSDGARRQAGEAELALGERWREGEKRDVSEHGAQREAATAQASACRRLDV